MKPFRTFAALTALAVGLPHGASAGDTGAGTQSDTFKSRIEALHQRLSARTGDPEAVAQMAMLKEQGDEITPIDLQGAFDLYEQAAARNNPIAIKKMCMAYLLGQGRPKDVVKASGFCNRVDAKDAVTLFWGGYDYQFGVSGPKDIEAAKAAYQQAFLDGSGDAADAIGQMAFDGGHFDAARSWYRRGASMGSAGAMVHLAGLAERGQGGGKDAVEAAWLYGLAAQRGNTDAVIWVAAHRNITVPKMVLRVDKTETVLTHTYGPPDKEKTETLTQARISMLMRTEVKRNLLGGGLSSTYFAFFDCYVRGDHEVDVCVPTREFPLEVGITRVLHAVWDGRVSVPERDVAGASTAQSHFVTGFELYFDD